MTVRAVVVGVVVGGGTFQVEPPVHAAAGPGTRSFRYHHHKAVAGGAVTAVTAVAAAAGDTGDPLAVAVMPPLPVVVVVPCAASPPWPPWPR